MVLSEVVSGELIKKELAASDKATAFVEMANLFRAQGVITNMDEFLRDLFDRELVEQTIIPLESGLTIGIPHSKSYGCNECRVAVARSGEGIDYEDDCHTKVNLIFMFACPKENSGAHLQLLAKFASMLCYEEFTEALMHAQSEQEMADLIFAYEQKIDNDEL